LLIESKVKKTTSYPKVDSACGKKLGPAQGNAVLDMLSRLSSATGLGFVTALVRHKDDPGAGEDFGSHLHRMCLNSSALLAAWLLT